MGFDTINELRTDALWLAGEPTDAAVSDYNTRVLGYLDAVQDAVITGGSLRSVVELPLEDWKWARPQPRRTVSLLPGVSDAAVTCTLNQGNATGTFLPSPGTLTGYRIMVPGEPDVPLIVSVESSPPYLVFDLDHPWSGATISTTAWKAAKVEYDLAEDHVRLVSGFILSSHGEISVIDRATFDDLYPFSSLSESAPMAACLVSQIGPSTAPYANRMWVRFSHYPASPGLVAEYDCIVRLPKLETDPSPTVTCTQIPAPYRRILSTGAATLILVDKGDNKYKEIFEQFQAIWLAMKKANSRPQHRAARGYGYIKPRQDQIDSRIRKTTSGFPVLW